MIIERVADETIDNKTIDCNQMMEWNNRKIGQKLRKRRRQKRKKMNNKKKKDDDKEKITTNQVELVFLNKKKLKWKKN